MSLAIDILRQQCRACQSRQSCQWHVDVNAVNLSLLSMSIMPLHLMYCPSSKNTSYGIIHKNFAVKLNIKIFKLIIIKNRLFFRNQKTWILFLNLSQSLTTLSMSTMVMFIMSTSVSGVKHGNVKEGNANKYCQTWQINYQPIFKLYNQISQHYLLFISINSTNLSTYQTYCK